MSRFILIPLCIPMLLSAQGRGPGPGPAPGQPAAPQQQAEQPVTVAPAALTSEQTQSIMKQLEQLESMIGKSRGDILGAALAKFRAALSSNDVVSLYLDCYRLQNFERKDLKQTDFQAWKDANETRLKDKDFLDALNLQLQYLVLTIQAQDITEAKNMTPVVQGLQAFIPKALAAVEETVKHTASGAVEQKNNNPQATQNRTGTRATGTGPGRQGGGGGPGATIINLLKQPVRNCEFSSAYLLDPYLKREKWSYSPLDFQVIYQTVIFPYYLETNPAELPAQWDAYINTELALKKITMSDSEYQVYFKERQPIMAWQKANAMLANNVNAIQAMAEMLKILRENPAHASAADWLKQLRQLVISAQPAAPPSPGATTAPPAAAATTTPGT